MIRLPQFLFEYRSRGCDHLFARRFLVPISMDVESEKGSLPGLTQSGLPAKLVLENSTRQGHVIAGV
jgi:hypothetical protein